MVEKHRNKPALAGNMCKNSEKCDCTANTFGLRITLLLSCGSTMTSLVVVMAILVVVVVVDVVLVSSIALNVDPPDVGG